MTTMIMTGRWTMEHNNLDDDINRRDYNNVIGSQSITDDLGGYNRSVASLDQRSATNGREARTCTEILIRKV